MIRIIKNVLFRSILVINYQHIMNNHSLNNIIGIEKILRVLRGHK